MLAARTPSLLLWVVVLGCQIPDAHPPPRSPPAAPVAYPYAPPPYAVFYPAPQTTAAPGQPNLGPPSQPVYQAPPAAPPSPPPSPPESSRPLLGALVGSGVWQAEARAVLAELASNLTAEQQRLVAGVPIVFDPSPNDVNAFASCDDAGAPFVAGTEGLLEAIDAIAQTKATDELYGTRTYDAYTAEVLPKLVSSTTATPGLPAGVLPANAWTDPKRA